MTSPTRRTFLRTGALAAITAGIALSPVHLAFGQDSQTPSQDFKIPYEAKLDPVFSFTKATFEPYVGGIFLARGAGTRTVELTLTAVRVPRTSATTATRSATTVSTTLTSKARPVETFTLVFKASGQLSELSTIYQLEHAALGKFSLFLTGVEDEKGQHTYEAVISHVAQ